MGTELVVVHIWSLLAGSPFAHVEGSVALLIDVRKGFT